MILIVIMLEDSISIFCILTAMTSYNVVELMVLSRKSQDCMHRKSTGRPLLDTETLVDDANLMHFRQLVVL